MHDLELIPLFLINNTAAARLVDLIGKPTDQSSERIGGGSSLRAVDGNINGVFAGNSCTHTTGGK